MRVLKKHMHTIVFFGCMLLAIGMSHAQNFYFGADLSYVNEMEDCGAEYKTGGSVIDIYQLFRARDANLVRLRLWHTPAWYDSLNSGMRYGDLQDVRESIARAKAKGMQVLLDFHLSDNWADPAHQVAPAAWTAVLDDLPVLQDSLYNYIYSTLTDLAADDLLPELVQIGNETNKGILQSQAQNDAGWWLDWERNAALFNTALEAVRDVEVATGDSIKTAIHIANPADVAWFIEQFHLHGVTEFDIIGISYYGSYHPVSISSVGNTIAALRDDYPEKEVMILETAYPWTTAGHDAANNLLSGVAGYPPSPFNQGLWMTFLTQTVISSGGTGVVYWEPGWVSTSCHTQWAQGSHWENAAHFDFENNEHGGAIWMTHEYDFSTASDDLQPTSTVFSIHAGDGMIFIKQMEDIRHSSPLHVDVVGMDGRRLAGPYEFRGYSSGVSTVVETTLNTIVLEEEFSPGVYVVRILNNEQALAVKKIVLVN